MALRTLIYSDNEQIRKISKPVKVFDDHLSELLDDMKETMIKNNGVGLAAPQVGVLKRAVVIDVNNMYLELVNPEIVSQDGNQYGVEGCLSVKGISGYCNRPLNVTVKAFDRYGKPFMIAGTELLAVCLCHEIDHLDGKLFTDIMVEEYNPKNKSKKENKGN